MLTDINRPPPPMNAPRDPLAAQKRYFKTEKGKLAKRKQSAEHRRVHEDTVRDYENDESRRAAKTSWMRCQRQRKSAFRELILLVHVYSVPLFRGELTLAPDDSMLRDFYLWWFYVEHRGKRKTPVISNPRARNPRARNSKVRS